MSRCHCARCEGRDTRDLACHARAGAGRRCMVRAFTLHVSNRPGREVSEIATCAAELSHTTRRRTCNVIDGTSAQLSNNLDTLYLLNAVRAVSNTVLNSGTVYLVIESTGTGYCDETSTHAYGTF